MILPGRRVHLASDGRACTPAREAGDSMMKTKRPTGVMVRLLDTKEVEDFAYQHVAKTDDKPFRVRLGSAPYAVGEHDGKVYVICVEGVGWEVTDDDPMTFGVHVEHDTERGVSFSIAPVFDVRMSKADVLAAAGEQIDLADLIRTFGDRLERNHAIWYRTLGGRIRG